MDFASRGGNSQGRALVPLFHCGEAALHARRASAPFIVQLAASASGLAAYRAKRRADPADGSNDYRAAAARLVAPPASGRKLDYCA